VDSFNILGQQRDLYGFPILIRQATYKKKSTFSLRTFNIFYELLCYDVSPELQYGGAPFCLYPANHWHISHWLHIIVWPENAIKT
jgi:hypothetical protein